MSNDLSTNSEGFQSFGRDVPCLPWRAPSVGVVVTPEVGVEPVAGRTANLHGFHGASPVSCHKLGGHQSGTSCGTEVVFKSEEAHCNIKGIQSSLDSRAFVVKCFQYHNTFLKMKTSKSLCLLVQSTATELQLGHSNLYLGYASAGHILQLPTEISEMILSENGEIWRFHP